MNIVRVAVLCAALAVSSGCGPSADERSTMEMRWGESVLLGSGETIRIQRHVAFRQGMPFAGPAGAATYTTSSIALESSSVDVPLWDAPMIPILLDRDPVSKEWIVIAGSDGNDFWSANGKPCPPQWAFRLRDGVWYTQPVPVEFLGRLPNLLADLRVDDDETYTEETFAPVAMERKAQQLVPYPKIAPNLVHVGVIYQRATCKPDEPPQFTDDFVPTAKNGSPDISRFPRL